MHTFHPARRAFTLLEGVLSIVIIAIIASLTLPVVNGASENFAEASSTRRATENVAFAMERAVRFLREAPAGTASNTLGVTSATAEELIFSNGTSIGLKGTDLMLMTDSGSGEGVLLSNVQSFQISYLGEDGTTSVLTTPQNTRLFIVTIKACDAELRCAAFPRVRMVPQ